MFVRYEMIYLANFQNIEERSVQIFILIGTRLIHLQGVNLENLPDDVKLITEFSQLTFDIV